MTEAYPVNAISAPAATIFRNTRLAAINLTTVQNGGGVTTGGFSPWASAYPRGGSVKVKRTNTAISIPGSPTTTKAVRQPYHSLIQPPTRKPISMPQLIPVPNTAIAVARCSFGYKSAMIECDGGLDPASPTPTPMRSNNN